MMPKIVLTRKKAETLAGDMLVCCFEHDKKKKLVNAAAAAYKEMKTPLSHNDFYGKEESSLLLYPDNNTKSARCSRLLLAGLGLKNAKDRDDARERCRSCGGVIAVAAGKHKVKRLSVVLPKVQGLKAEEVLECLVEGLLLGGYSFRKYKKIDKKSDEPIEVKEILIRIPDNGKNLRRGLSCGRNAAAACISARDMANEPGNGWTPASFAKFARMLAKQYKLKCTVLEKKDMKAKKMGGLLGVNQGSAEAPKLVILEYGASSAKAQTILLVGKGLTFDSGGISLKPGAGMQDMKYDMCGGAAVLSMMQAVGAEKPDVNVIAIVPATDNMPGGSALKPGDIVRHYGGTTSEIINTDAEGRLILADALAYGIETFKPDCVVDLATLTGAVIVGLGHHRTGLLGNNQKLVDRLMAAGKTAGEPLWQLPLDKEYVKQIESDVADIKNTGGPAAGTITAAAYLQTFVGDTPWVHLDIAGTAWNFTKKTYVPKGPSGTGTRTLVELVRNWKKI